MKNAKKIAIVSLAILTVLASFPLAAIPVLAETHLPTITLAQSVFSTPEVSTALTVTASQTSPDQSTASRSVKASTSATGSSVVEGWNYHPYGIRVDKYKFAKVTYYYDTNSDQLNPGTGNAVGQAMKFLVGKVSTSAGTALQVNGTDKWFANTYTSRDTIVANQEATCVIDFSGFYTTNYALLSANPTYNIFKQVKWTFFGLSQVDTLNIYDKMYIKKVEFFTYDPDTTFSPVTVTFGAGEGTGTAVTQSHTTFDTITFPTKPADFQATGRYFVGWNYNGTVYDEGDTTTFFDDTAVTIPAVWEYYTAYVSTDGVISGYSGTVYTTINDAVNALGSNGGIIYIEGDYNFTSTITMPSTTREKIYIKGYGDVATGGKLYTETKFAHFSVNGGDVEFDNITIGGPGTDETSWFSNGKVLTFASGVVYTDPSSGTHDLWLAVNGTRTANKINVNSSSIQATNVAPVQGYGTTASITGHTTYNLSAGTFANVYGLSRDGYPSSGGAKIYGDVVYNISGGNYSNILTGGNSGKTTMRGNVIYNINGGQFSSSVQFGGGNTANIIGHQAIVVNLKEYRQNSTDTNGFSIVNNSNQPASSGKKIAIINNYEKMSESSNAVSINSNAEYKIRVYCGKVTPVFEASSTSTSSTTYGALLGFSITPDIAGHDAYINDTKLTPNASGYYDLSAYEDTSTSGYIDIQVGEVNFTTTAVKDAVDDAADDLMNTAMYSGNMDISGVTGTVYYVSSSGLDTNNGTSTSTPWQTLTKVNAASLVSGDVVLFNRGDTFRGQLICKDGVKYSAYGTPATQGQAMNKPKIIGSVQNYGNNSSLWLTTSYSNVYKYNGTLTNVGIIAFDHTENIPDYDEAVGRRKTSGVGTFVDESDLDTDLDFYSNLTTNEFFLYSTGGNPGTRFTSIEIGQRADLVEVNSGTVGVTVDNICFMYGGSHGVGTGGRVNLTVSNNVFCWIGGSILAGYAGGNTVGYGNAIEIYGGVDGYYVKNNFIYQIYDTGITHQYSSTSTGNCIMNDIQYYDNLIMYCHWSIEYYNQPLSGTTRTVKNVDIQGNILRLGGYGWGSITQNRQTGATLFNSAGMSTSAADVENFVASDNIFDRSMGPLVRLPNTDGDKQVELAGNTYIQEKGKYLGMVYSSGTYSYYYYNAAVLIKNTIGDTTANVYFYVQ